MRRNNTNNDNNLIETYLPNHHHHHHLHENVLFEPKKQSTEFQHQQSNVDTNTLTNAVVNSCSSNLLTNSTNNFTNIINNCKKSNDIDSILLNYYEKVDLLLFNKSANYCCNHISDLALAAELGKTLLERNQDLQTNIFNLEQVIAEKNIEIQLLEKHLQDNKETLASKLRHLELIDCQNNDLEKQINFYKSCLDKEKLKYKELNDAFNELTVQYETLENEYKSYQQEYRQQKSPNYLQQNMLQDCFINGINNLNCNNNAKQTSNNTTNNNNNNKDTKCINNKFDVSKCSIRLKRSQSENNLNYTNICLKLEKIDNKKSLVKSIFSEELINNVNSGSLNVIFEKWLIIFQSYSHKKSIEFKSDVLKLKEENTKLNEKVFNLELNLNLLNKTNSILNIDLEEYQNINKNLEKKLITYENMMHDDMFQTHINYEVVENDNERILSLTPLSASSSPSSNSRKTFLSNKLKSFNGSSLKSNDWNGSIETLNSIMNDLNYNNNRNYLNKSLFKELESLDMNNNKKLNKMIDAETQYELNTSLRIKENLNRSDDDNNNNDNNLNTSKTNNIYSSYKDIFRQIYDTLNSSKKI